MSWECPEAISKDLKVWLGDDGIKFFQKCQEEHGTVSPVMMSEGSMAIPHPVHLREGMQVRNWLRKRSECKEWGAFDYDDRWTAVVKAAIAEDL